MADKRMALTGKVVSTTRGRMWEDQGTDREAGRKAVGQMRKYSKPSYGLQ